MRPRNLAGLIVSAVLIAGSVMHFAPSTLPTIQPVNAASVTVSLVANYPNWNSSNPTITVTKGDSVTISLSKTDAYTHQFLVDFDKDGAGDTSDCGTTDQCSGMFSTAPPPVGPFTVTANPGTYTYYCTVHYTYMTGSFVVLGTSSPDFSISSNPTSLTIDQGASGTTSINLNSLNGFSGTVNLTPSVSPSGPVPSVNPTSVSLSAGSSASSTLTVSTATSGAYSTPVAQGTYTVTVTASSGSLSHPTSVSLTVGSTTSTPPAGNSNLPVVPIIGGIIGAIVVVGVAVFLVKRKK